LKEIKKKVLEVKKSMLYEKTVDEKFVEHQLNTPRSLPLIETSRDSLASFNSARLKMNNNANLTTRSEASQVAKFFNLNNNNNEYHQTNLDLNLTSRTNKSVHFEDILLPAKEVETFRTNKSYDDIQSDTRSQFSLSFPVSARSYTARSFISNDDDSIISKQAFKSEEAFIDRVNLDFLKE
jgi:hypothetical protein